MAALYGSRWELEYGPVASPTGDLAPLAAIWAEALADFTGESIATGLRKCLDREADHPPTLPEFLRLCGRATHSAAACHQPMLTATPRQAPAESPSARCAQLAGTLADQAEKLGALWASWEARFGEIDADLGRAFEKLATETRKQSQILADQTGRIDAGLAKAVDTLSGHVRAIGDGAEDLAEAVEELGRALGAHAGRSAG